MYFETQAPVLGVWDVAVCGGGIAGFCAAVSAARQGARTVLLENGGYMGGTLTRGLMPNFLDAENKGGLVREILDDLVGQGLTCPRRGPRVDDRSQKLPGYMVDVEGAKQFFDRVCRASGVRVLYHSRVIQAQMENDRVKAVLAASDAGTYAVEAAVFIDASGNGTLAALAGNGFETGMPDTGAPQALSMSTYVGGYPREFNSIDSEDGKTAYNNMLESHGIRCSAGQVSLVKLPNLQNWSLGCHFQYGVGSEDIVALSDAEMDGRRECFDLVRRHAQIPGYEGMFVQATGDHIGVREGRRIFGHYRLSLEDILRGARFDDGVCLVTFGVDVHKLKPGDTLDNSRGHRVQPYHIPYRCLVPLQGDNLLLAGRCLSGDFYPHASYRVMGNMAATGEAAGYAAALCAGDGLPAAQADGRAVSAFMKNRGYAL